ncbi:MULTISPECIES: alpha-amylase family glycosyl hydrolase [unclassified Ruminococcus]|uniref:alpha-amylase family glycosyl hydrolase n=1 Tax=unclassified Ruminococcus TaxID=2608920 RepID=UPI00210BD715|nr:MULTISPECIES: alpha-amylase family glycosyl hydrolase [unclassified Ruminococcus]MCQ4022728.1 starch-binding protein [Ruminococcus sp. zg-924]MCQ4114968.1 starch-binding protein [Ruminococcus sp. zg-921]
MKSSHLRNKIAAVGLTLAMAASCFCIAPAASAVQTDAVSSNEASHGGDTFSWDNASVYFLLTDRFYNGDTSNDHSYNRGLDKNGNVVNLSSSEARATFHGGDFAGITKKIEEGYFEDLGVNAIWLSAPYEQVHGYVVGDNASPSFPHYSYHGYYVLDYTESDKNFGTKEEFQTLVDTAHEHGIRVVMDIVMNHSGYNSLYDMKEYGYGTVKSGWENYYYAHKNVNNGDYHSYIDYETSTADWAKWWGPNWIRSGLPGYTAGGGDNLTMSLTGLPDFKTESTGSVGIPAVLKTKWTKEGTYSQKAAKYGTSGTVSDYIVKWLSEWVETYGVDGFRCDTAKHVEYASWAKLKDACVKALKTWKTKNPDKALDNLDFWMTGEVWDHGVDKDAYYTQGKFDSLINFSTQGGGLLNQKDIGGIYQSYANKINTDPDFNVLSYLSSHDSVMASGDMIRLGSAFNLLPGAVQIYYGDESGRGLVSGIPFDGNGGAGHALRSDMNWNSMNEATLAHWQKVGTFRNNHIAVGGGSNTALTSTAGTAFARVYNKNNILDKVACVIDAGSNKDVTINVSSIWEDGQELINTYNDSSATVTGGKVTFNSGANGTILIQEPDGKPLIKLEGDAQFKGTQTITLTIDGAESAKVSVDGGNKFVVNNGGTFTIGDKAYGGSYVKVTAQATNEKGTSTKVSTFYKLNADGSGPIVPSKNAIIHVKPYDAKTTIYAWYGSDGAETKPLGEWPGTNVKSSGTPDANGYYTLNLKTTENFNFIINTGSGGQQTADITGNSGEIWVDVTAPTEYKIKEQEESGLDALKTEATAVKVLAPSEYTAASWSTVSSALSAAENVIAKGENATEAEIANARKNLSTAKAGLKLVAPAITTMAAGGTVIAGKTATEADVVVTVGSTVYKTKADDITGAYSVKVATLKNSDAVKVTATKNGVASEVTSTTVAGGPIIVGDQYIVGDVNGDGSIKLMDALMVARHSVKLETLTGISLAAADADGDGNVNLKDALLIQKYVAKMTVTSKIGQVKTYK